MIWLVVMFAVGYVGMTCQVIRWALANRDESLEEV